MIHLHYLDKKPIPHIAEKIEKQKQEGGQLILYRRAWSLLLITVDQYRVEHVPYGNSRFWAGWRHSLFTIFLGIWSLQGMIGTPILLFFNFYGGVDVTGQFSETSIDPLRILPPDPARAQRERLMFACTLFVLGLSFLAIMAYIYFG